MSYYTEFKCEIRNTRNFKKACEELGCTFVECEPARGNSYFTTKSGYRHYLLRNTDGSFRIQWQTDERGQKVQDFVQMYSVVEAEEKLHAQGIKTSRTKDQNGNLIVKAVGGPMDKNEMLILTADKGGKISVDAKGFKTNKCADVTKILDKISGKKVAEKKKPEYFVAAAQKNKVEGKQ